MPKTLSKYSLANICIICGHKNQSYQSVDHQCMRINQLSQLLESSKLNNPSIDALIKKMRLFYDDLQHKILRILNEDRRKVQEHLIGQYFSHLDMEKVNIKAISKIINEDYSQLPHKKFIRIVRKVKKSPIEDALLNQTPQFTQLQQQIQKYLNSYNMGKTINLQDFKIHLPFQNVVDKIFPPLQTRKSLSDVSNPEQVNQNCLASYNWKNSRLNAKSKSLQLSNKSISDQQLLREIPMISSLKDISEFQIRNNKLTAFGCRIIASNMKRITNLDVRGNRVGDEGIIKIAEGMPLLKSLMICETNCGNKSVEAILVGLPLLEMLWCENNNIDGEYGLKLAQKPKLKMLSLKGNKNIEQHYKSQIRACFTSKGYINI